ANFDEIEGIKSWGMLDDVTTNPSLIKESGAKDMEEHIKRICDVVGEGNSVSLEVISLDSESMVKEAHILHDKFNYIAGNVTVKIPISTSTKYNEWNEEGIKAIEALYKDGIRVNATLIFTPKQAIRAAMAGASYVSPFLGRLDDYLRENLLGWKMVKEKPGEREFTKSSYYPAEGMLNEKEELVNDNGIVSGVHLGLIIVDNLKELGYDTKVIAASLRNRRQVSEVRQTGVDVATIPYSVIKEIHENGFEEIEKLNLPKYELKKDENSLYHPKTVEGVIRFTVDVVPEYRDLFK
ncbi:MAG: transaldolase family protein, partial [Candidatus Aenigmarchaeota archaeon]|nr:transaldolase family protein [Candidatus Aenigmarchaeota archaeon]